MARIAIYPGSFDPITNGHMSLLRRALILFDQVIVAVAINSTKKPLFTVQERIELIREATAELPTVVVDSFSGLLVEYAAKKQANVLIRGMRALSDFEYEFQMALMNRRLDRTIESIFMMTDYKWFYISSTIIKEAASLNGDIHGLVPENVCRALKQKFGYAL
ncbi:MAG: pantetheine-phosphate adenylyltransferase [Deltaproteobacteria bacterium]|nr:pantetheine-phosphate adenylyltransferase [Deltaproteobacteria bacterium]